MCVRASCPMREQDGEAMELILERHGEDAVFARALGRDAGAEVRTALEAVHHDAARGAGSPTRRGAVRAAWETAGTGRSAV